MSVYQDLTDPLIPPPDYGVLTLAEVAERLKCSPSEVHAREARGLFFSLRPVSEGVGNRYPAFQLDRRLDQDLLTQMIKKYEEYDHLGASNTKLWSFLRTPNSMFSGKTPVDMLLGASPPGWEELSQRERFEALMDVVMEELSRIIW